MKRILLFIATNILVTITVSLILSLLGVGRYMGAYGLDYERLMIFCLVWGMVGSMISLMMSKFSAKWFMGLKVIDPKTATGFEAQLVRKVHQLAQAAGLGKMPEVALWDSPEINAFATGPSRNNSLVAVSTGLLSQLGEAEVEGVIGHEVAHIANGDMVTMALLQGVVNAFVMFLARVVAFAIQNFFRGNSDERDSRGFADHAIYALIVFVLEMVFMVFGSMVVCYFSRLREFRADAGGAKLAGRDRMIKALEALQCRTQIEPASDSLATMKISGRRAGGLMALLTTHPPLEERIDRLRKGISA